MLNFQKLIIQTTANIPDWRVVKNKLRIVIL